MSIYSEQTPQMPATAYGTPAGSIAEAPGTMVALSGSLTAAYEAVARLEKLADNLSGGMPQSVSGVAGNKGPVGMPPVASIIREHAASLADLANRVNSACYRIETAF